MNQNILIYSSVTLWKNHLNGMLDIIKKELDKKNNIYILSCDSSLESCPPNNTKNKLICNLCQKHQHQIYKQLFKFDERVTKLNFKFNNLKKNFNFKNYNQFQSYQLYKVPFGMLVSSDLVTYYRDSYLNFSEVKEIAINKLKSSILLYKKSLEIIKKKKIDVIYSWNGRRGSDGPVLHAAKKLNKKFYSYISSHSAKKLIIKNSITVHDLETTKKDISRIKLKNYFKNNTEIKRYLKKTLNILSKGKKTNNDFKTYKYFIKKNYIPLNYSKKKK